MKLQCFYRSSFIDRGRPGELLSKMPLRIAVSVSNKRARYRRRRYTHIREWPERIGNPARPSRRRPPKNAYAARPYAFHDRLFYRTTSRR
ncbi:hypothetical protein BCEP4_1120017 [Burkholderia cepacia]|nr:hypothetical protein BCEP4_1120017 [Burkholderia cepacia]